MAAEARCVYGIASVGGVLSGSVVYWPQIASIEATNGTIQLSGPDWHYQLHSCIIGFDSG